MRNITYTILLVFALLSMGCKKEGLDLYPLTSLTEAN